MVSCESGQWSVASGQWSVVRVVSGQWSVVSSSRHRATIAHVTLFGEETLVERTHSVRERVKDGCRCCDVRDAEVGEAHALTRSHACTLTHSRAHALTCSRAHALTRSRAHELTRSHAHALTRSRAHMLTHRPSHWCLRARGSCREHNLVLRRSAGCYSHSCCLGVCCCCC